MKLDPVTMRIEIEAQMREKLARGYGKHSSPQRVEFAMQQLTLVQSYMTATEQPVLARVGCIESAKKRIADHFRQVSLDALNEPVLFADLMKFGEKLTNKNKRTFPFTLELFTGAVVVTSLLGKNKNDADCMPDRKLLTHHLSWFGLGGSSSTVDNALDEYKVAGVRLAVIINDR